MKQLFGIFLILLMLTPSLACAMPMCMDDAAAQQAVVKSAAQVIAETANSHPCADHHANQTLNHDEAMSGRGHTGHVDLLLDCMDVDLQTADTLTVKRPKIVLGDVVQPVINTAPPTGWFLNGSGDLSRGPPPDLISAGDNRLSLILTTRRFRL